VDTLRSKLVLLEIPLFIPIFLLYLNLQRFASCLPFLLQEDTRQKLVISDNKVRQLETQVCEEQLASANGRKVIMCLLLN
jgi:hypothetical protein